MNDLNGLAIASLSAAIQTLLPPAPAPGLESAVLVSPLRIAPTGLGGFVGLNREPRGDIHGRRLEATVLISVRANSAAELNDAVNTLIDALAGADRASLAGAGILRLGLEQVGPRSAVVGGPGPGTVAERELSFTVLYEFLQRPEAAGGVIDRVLLDLETNRTGRPPRVLANLVFRRDLLGRFEVVDDPAATTAGPSQWQYAAVEQRIEQRAAVRGGSDGADPDKPGTALVLRNTVAGDFILRTTLESPAARGIGLVFRWQDPDNFYFFLMDGQPGYRLLGRKRAGVFEALDQGAPDATQGYAGDRPHELKLVMVAADVEVFLDGGQVLQGQDGALSAPGRVGFLSRGNDQAFFYRIDLTQL